MIPGGDNERVVARTVSGHKSGIKTTNLNKKNKVVRKKPSTLLCEQQKQHV